MEVSKDDFIAWKNDPVTTAVFDEVSELYKSLSEGVLDGAYTHDHDELNLQIGKLIGVSLIQNITHEDLT